MGLQHIGHLIAVMVEAQAPHGSTGGYDKQVVVKNVEHLHERMEYKGTHLENSAAGMRPQAEGGYTRGGTETEWQETDIG